MSSTADPTIRTKDNTPAVAPAVTVTKTEATGDPAPVVAPATEAPVVAPATEAPVVAPATEAPVVPVPVEAPATVAPVVQEPVQEEKKTEEAAAKAAAPEATVPEAAAPEVKIPEAAAPEVPEVTKEEIKGLRRNLNTNIRDKIKEADPISETAINQTLNIFGDRYDLNKATDLKGTAPGLVSFVTNYGINPNYKVDIPLIIKAFYSVFPDSSGGNPVAGYDKISNMPAYHLICNHIMYRMVTLKTEIQLQNRSSLRRGQLQDIYNKLDEFLQEGQCGRFSRPASEEAFRREQANKLLKRDEATGGLMVTAHLEQKLQYIITILNKMIEDGMRNRLTQLQAQGFDCGPMENLLVQLEKDDSKMSVSDMIKAYTDLKISPGGLKICISKLRQQMDETNDLSKLAMALGSVKTGKTLTIGEATNLISSLPRTGTAGQNIAEEVAKDAGIKVPLTSAPAFAPTTITRPIDTAIYRGDGSKTSIALPKNIGVDDNNILIGEDGKKIVVKDLAQGGSGLITIEKDKYVIIYTSVLNKTPTGLIRKFKDSVEPPVTAPPVISSAPPEEAAPEPIRPTDDRVYYDDGSVVKKKIFKKEKGKSQVEIIEARIPPSINKVDSEFFVLHGLNRYYITNIGGVKGYVKLINGKYIFVPEVTLTNVPEEIEPDKQPENTKDLTIKTVIVGGTLPDASGVYKTYNSIKDINAAIEGLDIVGNTLVVDPNQNTVLIEKIADEDAESFIPIKPTDQNTLNLWDTYKDGLTVGVPLTLLLQPTNQEAFKHINKQLISALMIPLFDATIVDVTLPNSVIKPNVRDIAYKYYISKITNSEGFVEVHNDMKTSGFLGLGSKPIYEQYALRLKDVLANKNAGKIVPLPSSDKDVAISNTIYYNIDLSDQPSEIANSTCHMIIFVKNKKDLTGNKYVATKKNKIKGQEFMDGHFIRFIFGKDVKSTEEIPEPDEAEPLIVPVSTLGITTLPPKTASIEVITPNLSNSTGTAISNPEPTIISAEAIDEEPDLAIYFRTKEDNLDIVMDDKNIVIQIRKDNYNINDDGSVNYVFRNKNGSIKKLLGPYKMNINDKQYTIIYDKDNKKFIADGYEPPAETVTNIFEELTREPEIPSTTATPVPETPAPTPETPAPTKSVTPPTPVEASPVIEEAAPVEETVEKVTPVGEEAPIEKEATPVEAVSTVIKTDPITPEPSNPGVKLYNGKDNIWDMVKKTYDSYTGRTSGALNTTRKDWTLLYNFFNDMNNKDYYNITRYNKYLTDKQFNGLPDNIKRAFTNVMNNRRIKDAKEQRGGNNTLRRARQRRNRSN